MPIPIIVGVVAGGLAAYGAVKGVKGAVDKSEANDINKSANSIVENAKESIELSRSSANSVVEVYGKRKLSAYEKVIPSFIEVFKKLKNVELSSTPELERLKIGNFSGDSLRLMVKDYELLKSSGLGVGAGLGSGAALAFGAYNGTMLLATASTGTAISTLSGAAATNATLAWLGGGSIAAGGGGIALGTMVLGGIVAGPALAIFGHIVGNKGEEALNNAKSNLEQAKTFKEEAKNTIMKLDAIRDVASLADNVFEKLVEKLTDSVDLLGGVIKNSGVDYKYFSSQDKQLVFETAKYAQLVKAMIDTPILDKDGVLVLSTEERIKNISAQAE